MRHEHHKFCLVGDEVSPDYFSPASMVVNGKPQPVLTVTAFVVTSPGETVDQSIKMTFERTELGAPWMLTKNYL